MRHAVMLIWVFVLLTCGSACLAGADDELRGPWPKPAAAPSRLEATEVALPGIVASGALTAWHSVLSRADGPRSVMYPTASGFLGQAVAKHGLLIGIMMTTDRLLHEWDEQKRAPRMVKYGVSRAYDPVEANDFWWARESK
jgi:uncharacterized protein